MSKITKNFSYQIAYRILIIITPLITSPIISRAFGASGVGLYSATLAHINYFNLLAMLGVATYGNRTIAFVQEDVQERSSAFWNIYFIQFCSSIIAIIAYFISFVFIAKERWILSLIQSLWLFSNLASISWFFFGMEQFRITVVRNTIIKIVSVLCIALFIRKPNDLYLYAIIMGGSALISELYLWRYIGKYTKFVKPTWENVKIHFWPVLKLFVPVIAVSIFRIMDKTMLDYLSNETEVGYYYSADKLINFPLGITTAISSVMLPRIVNVLKNDGDKVAKEYIRKAMELTVFLVSACSFGIAAIAEEFVPAFFGKGYDPCVTLIYCFVPVLLIKTLESAACSQYLLPQKMDKQYTMALFFGAFVNVITNYLLIPRLGSMGAVLGTLFAELSVLILDLIYAKEVPFVLFFIKQFQYVLFGVIMFVMIRVISDALLWSNKIKLICLVFMGAFIYLIMCCIWWKIKPNNIFSVEIRRFIDKLNNKRTDEKQYT